MDYLTLIFAFCGGAFGATLGALGAFVFTGIVGLVGIAMAASGSSFDFLGNVAFGTYFGPHISFAGGVAAAAFARKMGYIESGKNILKSLSGLKRPSVLVVGGVFGMLGYAFNTGFALMPIKLDTVALTVFVLAIIAKVAFGSTGLGEIFGSVPEDVKNIGGRYSMRCTNVWLPYVTSSCEKTIVGITAGGVSIYLTYLMLQNPETAGVAPFVGFCISAVSLIMLFLGCEIPVTHHITICASYGVVASGGSILWGFAAAVAAAYAGDFFARTFYCYGDTHVDPPATAIAAVSFVLMTLIPKGVYEIEYIAAGILVLFVIYSFIRYSQGCKCNIEIAGAGKTT
jgi:hypothetical protein